MRSGTGIGTRQHKAVIGLVGQRGPDLLTVNDPLAPSLVKPRFGFYVGQIGTRARFGVTLEPVFCAVKDTRQVFLFLLLTAEGDDSRPRQPFADMADTTRCLRPRVLLKEDYLLFNGQVTTAMFCRPADTGPVALCQLLFLGYALPMKHMFITGPATTFQPGKLAGQIVLQPAGDLSAKCFIYNTKAQFHCYILALIQ